MKYECVIRRRHRMATAIAACGSMEWDASAAMYVFEWVVPEDYRPSPLLVVEVEAYDNDTLVGRLGTMAWLYPGGRYRVFFPGDGNTDDEATRGGDPKPPGIALDFDLDDLLRETILVSA